MPEASEASISKFFSGLLMPMSRLVAEKLPSTNLAVSIPLGAGDATIAMKPQPESSSQEVLAGLVERVTYHNAENGCSQPRNWEDQ